MQKQGAKKNERGEEIQALIEQAKEQRLNFVDMRNLFHERGLSLSEYGVHMGYPKKPNSREGEVS